MAFLHKLLGHQPPYNFQRTRRYSVHAYAKSATVKDTIETKLKRHGRTIRTVMEIISHLIHMDPFKRARCESKDFTVMQVLPDKTWEHKWITLPKIRAPSTRINISHSPSAPIFQ